MSSSPPQPANTPAANRYARPGQPKTESNISFPDQVRKAGDFTRPEPHAVPQPASVPLVAATPVTESQIFEENAALERENFEHRRRILDLERRQQFEADRERQAGGETEQADVIVVFKKKYWFLGGFLLLLVVGVVLGVSLTLPSSNSGTQETVPARSVSSSRPPTMSPSPAQSFSQSMGDPTWSQMGRTIIGTSARYSDGLDMSADGQTLIVAAPWGASLSGKSEGQVSVYMWEGEDWVQKGEILSGSGSTWSSSPVAISADGDTIAIGTSSSRVTRLYAWTNRSWIQLGEDITGSGDFGFSVALSSDGRVVAVGSPEDNYVQVFSWDGSEWLQRGANITGVESGDEFGFALSLSRDGNTLAVTGRRYDGFAGEDSGHARIYQWDDDGENWIQRGLHIEGKGQGDWFGYSVDLSSDGQRVVLGSFFGAGGAPNAGTIQVFSFSGIEWVQEGRDIDGTGRGDYFANLKASSDAKMVVGGGTQEANGHEGYSMVYRFDAGVDDWVQVGQTLEATLENEEFGTAVAMSDDGETIAIGASRRLSSPGFGAVKIYRLVR